MTTRTLTADDTSTMLEVWNGSMVHDRLSGWELKEAVFGSADYDAEGVVGVDDGAGLRGFVAAVVPEHEPQRGRIAAICGGDGDVVAALLASAEAYFLRRGAQDVVAAEYFGCNLAPGIDLRYTHMAAGFGKAGYAHTHTLEDMEIELTDYEPTPYQREARRRAQSDGVEVVDWRPSLVAPLRAFAARAATDLPASWFGEGWERGPDMLVAVRGDEVIGYASYWPRPAHTFGRYHRPSCGAFGPIGVLKQHRGRGVGTWLLSESQLRVKQAGRAWLWAGWTNTPFYIPNGWHVSRRYAVWQKQLTGSSGSPE
jgi:GNAT superfamily N-acetyltransferase